MPRGVSQNAGGKDGKFMFQLLVVCPLLNEGRWDRKYFLKLRETFADLRNLDCLGPCVGRDDDSKEIEEPTYYKNLPSVTNRRFGIECE